MTDRELLELAAKAARIEISSWSIYGAYVGGLEGEVWNPLTDDGDALRLAVKLGIGTQSYAALGYSHAGSESVSQSAVMKEQHNGDPFAATRRAIVRAAAAVGASS